MAEHTSTRALLERIARLEAEPTSCPCVCHKPKHEARKPHPRSVGTPPKTTGSPRFGTGSSGATPLTPPPSSGSTSGPRTPRGA